MNRGKPRGNLEDYKQIDKTIFELRFFFDAGYRIYFGQENKLIILLCGGNKNTQKKDVESAQEY